MAVNGEKKSGAEEKKYAQLPREYIKLLADSAGYPEFNDFIAGRLAEDTNYRLREIAQCAGQFMRHAKRRKLTTEDFNKALYWSDVEPLYGYGNPEPIATIYVKEAEIFCTEDKEVNLLNAITAPSELEQPAPTCLRSSWLAVEGVSKIAASTAPPEAKKNEPVPPTVSDDLMSYYDYITKAILGNDEEMLKLALDDLESNGRIAPLLPYLVNFVSVGVKKMSHDLTQLTKLLHTVQALVKNYSLYLGSKPYLSLLVQTVQYCILEPLAASINPINDHWMLRDSAAQLLARIVREWSTPVNKLKSQVLEALKESFTDLSKPFCTHYGAVMAIIAFGIEAMEQLLYPYMSHYWPHLITALNDCNYISAQIKADAQKVYGALLLVAELIITTQQKEILKQQECGETINKKMLPYTGKDGTEKHTIAEVYSHLYEYFGDALAARLPYVPVEKMYVPKEEPMVTLFTYPELQQTGEEFLEAFYEKEDEVRSNNSMEDDNSDDYRDDNSILSDDHEADPVDLQIKSTISDPTLGIKLTIAKLRRTKPPPEEPKGGKRKKLALKTSREPREPEPVFDIVPLKHKDRFIEVNFEGATPVDRNELKCRKPPFQMPYFPEVKGSVAQLSLRLKKTGNKGKRNPQAIRRLKFVTGSLMNIL